MAGSAHNLMGGKFILILVALCLSTVVNGFSSIQRNIHLKPCKGVSRISHPQLLPKAPLSAMKTFARLEDSSQSLPSAELAPTSGASRPLSESKTVVFAAGASLTSLEKGLGVESDPFTLCGKSWQVVLYPNGQSKQGSGMGYFTGVNGAFRPTHASFGRTGIYLRYLPTQADEFADCVFTLALKGQQKSGPRFDVAFDCGMRFAGSTHADTSNGVATDWGAHVAPSSAIGQFTRQSESGDGEVCIDVSVTLFGEGSLSKGNVEVEQSVDTKVGTAILEFITPGMDSAARKKLGVFWRVPMDIRRGIRVGQVVIPTTLSGPTGPTTLAGSKGGDWRSTRDRMFQIGAYPGVEYRIMGMKDRSTGSTLFKVPGEGDSQVDVIMRPIYPVVKVLEREWPVTVRMDEVPCFLTQAMYNSLTLIGTSAWSLSLILLILLGREALSFYKIPSASMEPTIMRGDLILAEKITPKFKRPARGEIILFEPPGALREVVESQGGSLGARDLFVKRVAALPGDVVSVSPEGRVSVNGKEIEEGGARGVCNEPNGGAKKLVRQQLGKVKEGASFVLGDCSPVSVDSRVWGALGDENFRARPILTLWPPAHFGLFPK